MPDDSWVAAFKEFRRSLDAQIEQLESGQFGSWSHTVAANTETRGFMADHLRYVRDDLDAKFGHLV